MYCVVKAVTKENSDHPWHLYTRKTKGRYCFQMDLGLELISCGLGMDWKSPFDEGNKPGYVRKQNYIPCGCNICFFCRNGKTHGIDHMSKGQKRATSFKVKNKCVEERTNIGKTHTCNVCYKKMKAANPSMKASELKRVCKSSRLGCPGCNGGKGVFICKECWVGYEHY